MLTLELRRILKEMHAGIAIAGAACEQRPIGWRQQIVQVRRQIADALGRMGALASGPSISPEFAAFRGALSRLRSVVAELQASWPTVTLDPESTDYKHAVQRVGSSLEVLENALSAIERSQAGGQVPSYTINIPHRA